MTEKEKILAEIDRQIDKYHFSSDDYEAGKKAGLLELKSVIKSLTEEPVSKGLEERVIPTKLKNVFNDKNGSMSFDVDTPRFIKEECENSGSTMYDACWNIFKNLLAQVAERATELNDPVLNTLMIRLNLYEIPNEERYKMIEKMKELYDASIKE